MPALLSWRSPCSNRLSARLDDRQTGDDAGQAAGGKQQDGEHADARSEELPLGVEEPPPAEQEQGAQHRSGQRAVEAENGSAGILDRQLLVVAGEEQSAGLKPRGGALALAPSIVRRCE